jgi:hypothetical protein
VRGLANTPSVIVIYVCSVEAGILSELKRKYLQGECDKMAVAIATYFQSEIVAIYPVHIKRDGTRQRASDFLHAFARLPDGENVDVKGARSVHDMLKDVENVTQLIKREDDVEVAFEFETYQDAESFIECAGTEPRRFISALNDAAKLLPDLIRKENFQDAKYRLQDLMDSSRKYAAW